MSSSSLNPCSNVRKAGEVRGTPCARRTRHESGMCHRCRKSKSAGKELRQCSHTIVSGTRRHQQCTTKTVHESGRCSAHRNSQRSRCPHVMASGARKGEQCPTVTSHESGYCSHHRSRADVPLMVLGQQQTGVESQAPFQPVPVHKLDLLPVSDKLIVMVPTVVERDSKEMAELVLTLFRRGIRQVLAAPY